MSQSTTIKIPGEPLSLSVNQKQNSQLHASFHQAIPGLQLEMGDKASEQNYEYVTVNDSASSEADIDYEDGHLTKAALQKSANQSTHTLEYMQARLVSDTTTPASASWSKSFLMLLSDANLANDGNQKPGSPVLSGVSQYSVQQADPTELRAEG